MSIVTREEALENYARMEERMFIPLPEDNICRVIGRHRLEFDYDRQTLEVEYTLGEWMGDTSGDLNTGLLTLCADTTTGSLTHMLTGRFAPTVSISISCFESVRAGETIAVKAYATHIGRTNARLRAEIYSRKTGRLAASAEAVHFVADNGISNRGIM